MVHGVKSENKTKQNKTKQNKTVDLWIPLLVFVVTVCLLDGTFQEKQWYENVIAKNNIF